MENLTLGQIKRLRELKKKYAYDLAAVKSALEAENMTEKEILETLLLMEMNEAVMVAIQPIIEDTVEKGVLTETEMVHLLSSLTLALSASSIDRLKELGAQHLSDIMANEFLYLYNEQCPNVRMAVFTEDGVHTYGKPDLEYNDEE